MKHIDEEGHTYRGHVAHRFRAHKRASQAPRVKQYNETYTRQLRSAQKEATGNLDFYVRLEDLSAFEEHTASRITRALAKRVQQPIKQLRTHQTYILGTLIPQLRKMAIHDIPHIPPHD